MAEQAHGAGERENNAERDTDNEMDEQVRLLRDAFAINPENARGVVAAELARLDKIITGTHPDPRLGSEEARERARAEHTRYEELRQEFRKD